jgi:hypothetical protein
VAHELGSWGSLRHCDFVVPLVPVCYRAPQRAVDECAVWRRPTVGYVEYEVHFCLDCFEGEEAAAGVRGEHGARKAVFFGRVTHTGELRLAADADVVDVPVLAVTEGDALDSVRKHVRPDLEADSPSRGDETGLFTVLENIECDSSTVLVDHAEELRFRTLVRVDCHEQGEYKHHRNEIEQSSQFRYLGLLGDCILVGEVVWRVAEVRHT